MNYKKFSVIDNNTPISEEYKKLIKNIQKINDDNKIRSIVFTSNRNNEGKTTVAINYAIILAQLNKRVLLIDADLSNPTVNKYFKILNYYGLTNVLSEKNDYQNITDKTSIQNLFILTSGEIPSNPDQLLASKAMKNLLNKVLEEYDIVIIDSPPLGSYNDSSTISSIVEGTILVIASNKTDKNSAKNAKESLKKAGANILGVILYSHED